MILPRIFLVAVLTAGWLSTAPAEPVTNAQRVQSCGHSFHVFVPTILDQIVLSAGYTNPPLSGREAIGGSRVIMFWDKAESPDMAKALLRNKQIDVLTLSPIWLPDPGIENFARLAHKHNPDARVTIQEFWLPNDRYDTSLPMKVNQVRIDHNATDLAKLRQEQADYTRDMDAEVRRINTAIGHPVVLAVPAGQATLALREKIAAGQAFGLKSQEDLFTDWWGHPALPLQVLTTYLHYAVIYRRSPVGLPMPKIMADKKNPNWDEPLNRLLQEIAWEAVTNHPLTGVKGQ